MPRAAASAPQVPPRSTMTRIATGSAPNASHDVDRLHDRGAPGDGVLGDHDLVAGLERAGEAARDAVVLGLLADAEAAQRPSPRGGDRGDAERHRVGAHRQPADGRGRRRACTSSAASATSRMPSGRQAVCLVSRNHVLRCPDFSVKLTPAARCARARAGAARPGPSAGDGSGDEGLADPTSAVATVHGVQLRIFTEPQQGASYDDLLAVAQTAERLGFDAFFRSDHYLVMGERRRPARARPTRGSPWPGWPARPSRIRLGTLVTSATFRLPGPLAISVAQVDQMSGGRVELGLGAGWYEAEHRRLRHPVPAARRALRAAGGAARHRHRAVGDTGRRAVRLHRPPLRRSTDSPGPAQAAAAARARRSSSAATDRPARPASRPGTRPSSTWPSRRSTSSSSRAAGCGRPARRSTATRPRSCTPPRSCCAAGRTRPSSERRAAAIGREPDELRENGAAGTVAEVPATLDRWRRGRRGAASTSRCSTWATSTTSSWSPPRSCPSSVIRRRARPRPR